MLYDLGQRLRWPALHPGHVARRAARFVFSLAQSCARMLLPERTRNRPEGIALLLKVRDEIADAARQAVSSIWFERLARLGYSAKGLVFAVIGILCARVALGDRQEDADATGALEILGDQPVTVVLLVILAVGLTGYSLWRMAQAFLDVEGEGSSASGIANRAIYFSIGVSYGFLAVVSVLVLTGWRRQEGDEGVREITALALELPLGPWLVGVAGAVIMLAGLRELLVAVTGRFREEYRQERLSTIERGAALWTGWYGHFARGVAFGLAGFFAVRAAATYDPDEAKGLADTFRALADEPFGTPMLLAIAAGFIAFGLYCGLLALHRHIPNDAAAVDGDDEP